MKLFEDKDKCMIESDIKNISTKLLETLQLIDKTLKQEYETFNRNSLLILLKEGYGKYIASITKIFETYKPELNEIFINFKQKFTEIFDKIKEFFFNRYLCVDEELLEKYKVDLNLKEEKKSRKNSGFSKIKSLSISSESENLKDISLEQEPNENQHKNVVFNDPNLEFNHFRKKLCVKIAKTLQMQYNYEKQKSHEITMKIERKLRKEFPLLNSDYKSNGIMLLNLLKVIELKGKNYNYINNRIILWISSN